ncbi:hypothetical protein LQL77_30225 [Rhodococcus cerastii]|nr:hypothetical protein [Rhodococcus cerastii]
MPTQPSAHFQDIYGATVSKDIISDLTDKEVGEIIEWAKSLADRGWFPPIEGNHRSSCGTTFVAQPELE